MIFNSSAGLVSKVTFYSVIGFVSIMCRRKIFEIIRQTIGKSIKNLRSPAMASSEKMDLRQLLKESSANNNVLTMGTTVDTGFEWQAVDECKEKLGKNIRILKDRGKIYFNAHWDQFSMLQEMRSIDNIYIVADVHTFAFNGTDKCKDLELIKDAIIHSIKLDKSLNAWKHMTGFAGKMFPTIDDYTAAVENHEVTKGSDILVTSGKRKRGLNPSNTNENNILKYRVTCERNGTHCFASAEVATVIGGQLQDKYHWLVDLSVFHLEIFCKLVQNELITQLRVTHTSKHIRNIKHYGPTTLRATICYNLLRLAEPKPGDIIIDPMCGGGSIPIEAALAYSTSYILAGDSHPKAVNRSRCNIDAVVGGRKIDLVEWNATKLPFNDSFIDIIVTDMPFGKRSGNKFDNRTLYKQFLLELGRIVTLSTSRLVLLTADKKSFNTALRAAGNLFQVTKMLGVNMGGIPSTVYVLKRTNMRYEEYKPKISKRGKKI